MVLHNRELHARNDDDDAQCSEVYFVGHSVDRFLHAELSVTINRSK